MLHFNFSGNPLCFWVKSCELFFWSLQLCFGEFSCVNFPEIHRDLFPLKLPRSRLSGIGSASVPRAKRLCISEVFSWWGPVCLKIGYPWLGTPFPPALINDDQWQFLATVQFQTYPVGAQRTRTQALRPAISPVCIVRQNPLTIFNAYADDPGNWGIAAPRKNNAYFLQWCTACFCTHLPVDNPAKFSIERIFCRPSCFPATNTINLAIPPCFFDRP